MLSNFVDHRGKLDHILQIMQMISYSDLQSSQLQANQALRRSETQFERIRVKQGFRATKHAQRQRTDVNIERVLQNAKSPQPAVHTLTANDAVSDKIGHDVRYGLVDWWKLVQILRAYRLPCLMPQKVARKDFPQSSSHPTEATNRYRRQQQQGASST